jgi:hypothetical protein
MKFLLDNQKPKQETKKKKGEKGVWVIEMFKFHMSTVLRYVWFNSGLNVASKEFLDIMYI